MRFRRPVQVQRSLVAKLDVRRLEVSRSISGSLEQRPLCLNAVRQDPPVVHEGHGDQQAAKEPTGEEDQRQDAAS